MIYSFDNLFECQSSCDDLKGGYKSLKMFSTILIEIESLLNDHIIIRLKKRCFIGRIKYG